MISHVLQHGCLADNSNTACITDTICSESVARQQEGHMACKNVLF